MTDAATITEIRNIRYSEPLPTDRLSEAEIRELEAVPILGVGRVVFDEAEVVRG